MEVGEEAEAHAAYNEGGARTVWPCFGLVRRALRVICNLRAGKGLEQSSD